MKTSRTSASLSDDFLAYWESLGFFGYSASVLPQKFMLLFDIARILETDESCDEVNKTIAELSDSGKIRDIENEIIINRVDKSAPLGDRMELDRYRSIFDLKKALPRELASDEDIFEVKLFTKSLMVQRYFETDEDNFSYINTLKTGERDSNRFEQKFYILLDRSKSMDKKMRSFYAKCIVTELLHRKLNSGARLYYRSFDSNPGPLFRITDRNDYPAIIREILLTQTGGSGTNIQRAILQAVDDINYDSDMMHSEILLITDGLSAIDQDLVKTKLGQIRLNILKIGEDEAEPDWFAVEEILRRDNINIDPFREDMVRLKGAGKKTADNRNTGLKDVMLNRVIHSYQLKIERDLKSVSYKYFDIKDINASLLYTLTPEQEAYILHSISELEKSVKNTVEQDDRVILYKKIYFLFQYISMLLETSKGDRTKFGDFLDRLYKLKALILEDQEIFLIVSNIPELHEDQKLMKAADKEAHKMMKKVNAQNRSLTIQQMKIAKLRRGGVHGQGNPGELFALLLIKMFEALKKIARMSIDRITSKSWFSS